MFLNIPYIEWLGYSASVIVAVSLLMSSIIKLRWLNLLGALMISAYGFMLGSLPVGGLNLAIAFIDIYYLYAIYTEKEYFKVLEIKKDDRYLKYFLDYYKKDIKVFFPEFNFSCCEQDDTVSFYILRNMITAGVFIGKKCDDGSLMVQMDFAIPEYRDFKIGYYIYIENEKCFAHSGYNKFSALTTNLKHETYLKKMGFSPKAEIDGKMLYTKPIRPNDVFGS
ncbi:MAG TPA: hypothetical protein PKK26_06520 [Candidatus Wallbacteria bacterium]|mgnify:CR=1 FL=1|nr:hypothetical protein [Candidatus Wallbacteria bacterium]